MTRHYDYTAYNRHQGHASRASYLALFGKAQAANDAAEIQRMKAEQATRTTKGRTMFPGWEQTITGDGAWEAISDEHAAAMCENYRASLAQAKAGAVIVCGRYELRWVDPTQAA